MIYLEVLQGYYVRPELKMKQKPEAQTYQGVRNRCSELQISSIQKRSLGEVSSRYY